MFFMIGGVEMIYLKGGVCSPFSDFADVVMFFFFLGIIDKFGIDFQNNRERCTLQLNFLSLSLCVCMQVPGGPNFNNYANVELIVDVALRRQVHAVWAGWGHASENPALPELLKANGIIFLGPGARAMRLLGDKIGSSILAQNAGVPTLPWSGSHVTCGADVTDEEYEQACCTSLEEAITRAEKVSLERGRGGGSPFFLRGIFRGPPFF